MACKIQWSVSGRSRERSGERGSRKDTEGGVSGERKFLPLPLCSQALVACMRCLLPCGVVAEHLQILLMDFAIRCKSRALV